MHEHAVYCDPIDLKDPAWVPFIEWVAPGYCMECRVPFERWYDIFGWRKAVRQFFRGHFCVNCAPSRLSRVTDPQVAFELQQWIKTSY
jgi:hypothetical protein